ncbi:MAG TPA: CapA family protein [Bacteroidales bacterium]|nr:CapA family protein [Bacteroidales bacterium]
MKPVTIIIGGDLAPTGTNFSFFGEGNIDALVDRKLLDVLEAADARIFNLELPLTDVSNPIKKDGPNNKAPVSSVNGIKKLNPSCLGLANNHIMDHDDQGLFSTLRILEKNYIPYTGVGGNIEEAARPYIFEFGNTKIGLYTCAEHEFSIAGEDKAGANPFDPLESTDHIAEIKSVCDYVIVLYHGGKELYRYPSPYLQKVCRKMAQKGADLVVCQHSHCIGAAETYDDSVLVYGQGNFLFDRTDDEHWQTSLLVKATFTDKMTVDYIPLCRKGPGIEAPDEEHGSEIMSDFILRSGQIREKGFVEREFSNYCSENGLFYLDAFAGFGRVLRKVDSLLHGLLSKMLFSLKKLNMIQNFVECEAHRELFINYLRIKRKD